MYIILLKTPIEGEMQVECVAFAAYINGVACAPDMFIPLSNIDSIIVKPE